MLKVGCCTRESVLCVRAVSEQHTHLALPASSARTHPPTHPTRLNRSRLPAPAAVECVCVTPRRKKDAATAILDPSKKRSPNRMVVDEATSDDNSVVALSTAKVRLDARIHSFIHPLFTRSTHLYVLYCTSQDIIIIFICLLLNTAPRSTYVVFTTLSSSEYLESHGLQSNRNCQRRWIIFWPAACLTPSPR